MQELFCAFLTLQLIAITRISMQKTANRKDVIEWLGGL